MNHLLDSWQSAKNREEINNYLAKIVDHEILLPNSSMEWKRYYISYRNSGS
jgi:hypothetical protein